MPPRIIWRTRVLFLVYLCTYSAKTATFHEEDDLRKALFVNYSNQIRPVLDQYDILFVNASFTLYSVQHLDSKKQILTTTASLALEWVNELLTWQKEDYGGIDNILLLPSKVWVPDVVVYNGATGHNFMGSDEYLIRLFNDGRTHWFPASVLETRCSIAISRYPFDTQKCDIEFSLWMNPAAKLQIVSIREKVDMTLFTANGEWEVTNQTVNNDSIQFEVPYSFLTVKLLLKRRVAYHLINTVLPVIILSILNVLVFVLPPEAGEKMSLAITVLLAYAVFLSIVNENMPAISTSVSILAVYMILILAVGTMSTFLSAVVLHYAYNDHGRHRRFFSLDCLRSIRKKDETTKSSSVYVTNANNSSDKDTANGLSERDRKERPQKDYQSSMIDYNTNMINPKARDLVDKIDVISFWIFSSVTVLLFIVVIAILSTPGI